MSFIFAVVVAAVFVYAGVAKFVTFNNWTFQARALGAPDPFVVLVPVAEITLGVMLVGGWWLSPASYCWGRSPCCCWCDCATQSDSLVHVSVQHHNAQSAG